MITPHHTDEFQFNGIITYNKFKLQNINRARWRSKNNEHFGQIHQKIKHVLMPKFFMIKAKIIQKSSNETKEEEEKKANQLLPFGQTINA